MKVTIDLDKLLEEDKISKAEYEKFSQFAARGTATLAFNILVAFGVITVSGSTLALLPTETTAIALGLVICAAGIALAYVRNEQWMVLADICVVVGALLFGGGIIGFGEGSIGSFLLVTVAFAGAGIFARSWLVSWIGTLVGTLS